MIAIKDMKMPKACTSTQEILGDIEVVDCPLYNVCKHRDTRVNYKPSDCPLVEIITCNDCSQVNCSYHEQMCDTEEYRPNFYCADAVRRI